MTPLFFIHNIIPVFIFIFGALVGSFLNVCIYRLPSGASIVFPSSHCPKCKAKIKPYDNIPIFSYIILGGKCRSCRERFSARYPLIELISALFALFLYLKFGLSLALPYYYLFICTLIVITFIDIDHYIIPDIISIPMIAIGLLAAFFKNDLGLVTGFKSAMLGAITGACLLLLVAALYYVIKKKEGMGMGDVKLLAMLGAFLGLRSIFFIIFISSLIGAAYGIPYIVIKKKTSQHMLPFGPFLAAAGILYLFYGEEIISFYIRISYL
jgi:leader peptidase (prepilin peptidase)/N-methyltransferase